MLFETGRCYHDTQKWYLKILLLMPDHLHMLVGIPGNADLSNLLRDFKRVTATIARIHWQRNFFDHRLRHDESEAEKFEYIRQNPVRAGLINISNRQARAVVNPWRHSNRCRSLTLPSPFGNDFINHLFWIAIAQHRIILIILSPIKNVAVISLRRFQVLPDFLKLASAQLENVPSYPIALRS